MGFCGNYPAMRKAVCASIIVALAACAPVQPEADKAPPAGDDDPIATISKIAEGEIPESFDWEKTFPSWFAAVPPFRVAGPEMGGVYYVGTAGLGMYFIPTPDGHIVLDGGMPGQGKYVADAIRTLGFDPADIKILLNSHAHLDHSGGLAELKQLSGAQMVASEGDRSALEDGFYLGSEEDSALNAPPVEVDRIIADGEQVGLGGITLTARITPGHTRGCTSWMMDLPHEGKSLQVLFFCSATVAANRLVGPPQYAGIVADYRRTFALTRDWQPDILLANHPEFFGLQAKRAAQTAGDSNAFVDQDAFPRLMAGLEKAFERALAKQKGAEK
ncbi:metallo-beta-lactamase class B [Parasphingorhabdus marina DSM 22363]|uniref:Metallo-beta-lactamase class B n=2 Tax=Parasphingorhabdus marina TaxID=394732 RepID=A0A1N6CSA9_9SPHN|nr:metallo-beta-lactamase class B [Parasphingorhabdus marina DSM 22363]